MIHIIRANHTNSFELQNYAPIAKELKLNVITSHHPLTPISIPSHKLWSPTDFPQFPYRRQLLNRVIGGEQWLIGLDDLIHPGDMIHTAETYTPYTHQAVEMRKNGKISKLICTCWETIPHNNEKFATFRKWKLDAYKYIDIFHTPTERAKSALIVEGVEASKIKVIPYGVDLARFHSRVTQRVIPKGRKPVVLTVARFEKEKGMAMITKVAKSFEDIDFLIVGSGTHPPSGPNIRTQEIAYDKIHEMYQKADIFYLPSQTSKNWEEQYGMALVEAMASGVPIITTDSGAIPEVVGISAIVRPAKDIRSHIEAIDGVLSYRCNVLQLSRSGRARAERLYDIKKISAMLKTLY